MAQRMMERKASDNKYLHRDFHCTLNIGIDYIGKHYGEDAVKDYINRFVKSYYLPMNLDELRKYFSDVFEAEESSELLKTQLSAGKLHVDILECPAMKFMRSIGTEPSQWYGYTTTLLYKILAEDICGLKFNLIFYNSNTGKASFDFEEVK